jgi:signal transduction histidine kinase
VIPQLFIHNIGFVVFAALDLGLGIFVFIRGWRKKAHILYLLTTLTFVSYCILHLLSVNEPNPYLSYWYLSHTVVVLLMVCLNAHLAFVMFNKEQEQKKPIILMYAGVLALILIFYMFPWAYQALPEPKYYFENFIVPGPLYPLYMGFFFVVAIYFFSVLGFSYRKSKPADKNRLKYFFVAFGWAYLFSIPIFLNIYGFPLIDMMYTPLVGLYAVPLAYGVFKYDLISINVAAKNALIYAFYTVFVGTAIVAVNIFNNYLANQYLNFPMWLLPMLSGVFVVLVGWVVWQQIREADLLKYEFINNISHKFRTPLTHIRWLAEDLRNITDPETRSKVVEQIQFASMRLFELTNIVIDTSESVDNIYLYHFTPVSIEEIVREIDKAHEDQVEHKKLKVTIDIGPDVPKVKADKTRLRFALQILFENSLIYTTEGGEIIIKVRQIGGEVIISVRDNGIGITQEDLPHVFSKFYRSQEARHTDTEGMGVGLFMAKDIVEKHNGRVWAESRGENLGSTFSIALPIE